MKKLIHIDKTNVGRLHCDACHYDLPEPITWGRHLVGHPCPRCGASMLTERDYNDQEKFFRRVDWLNKWFGWLGREISHPTNRTVAMKLHNGKIEVRPETRR